MSGLVNALDVNDSSDKKRLGENLHCEYEWSTNNKDKIVQLYFQLVRTNSESEKNSIADLFIETFIKSNKEEKILLLKVLLNTRDIISGKGEKAITYSVLHKLSFIEPNITKLLIKSFVYLENNDHSIGSWADIKYMWSLYEWNVDFVFFFTKLINDQVKSDLVHIDKNISLVSKWVPRQTNKHKNIFKILAKDYFSEYFTSSGDYFQQERKAYTNYRKIITKLSRKIDVTQIKQCANQYDQIDYNKVTSITINKQKNAFSNKNGILKENRIKGASNFEKFVTNKFENNKQINGSRVSLYSFIKEAIMYNSYNASSENIKILNSQWKDSEKTIGNLGNFIAMVDTSGSMQENNNIPLYNAIGLGLRVAEKSLLGKRIMAFNSEASWINLENESDLTSMVKKIQNEPWGMNTNFMNALDNILDSIINQRLKPNDIKNLTLCVFSDMQIDYADKYSLTNSFWETIKEKYKNAGIYYFGIPYDPPNILFWNMRMTKGFPVMVKQNNVSMLSGFSPVLLNIFCNKGYNELKNINSYSLLIKILNNEKYNFVNKIINET